MIAENLISLTLPVLKPSDFVGKALDHMAHERVFWLPIADDEHFLGMISEDMLLEEDNNKKIAELNFDKVNVFVNANQHYFDVMKMLNEFQTGSVAVLDQDQKYIGSITKGDVLNYITNIGYINSPGGILVLSVLQRDYSLAEISRIIESNDMKAICVYVSNMIEDTYEVAVTIKLDKTDLTRLIASFERYGYKILADFHETSFKHHDSERLELLLKYLSI
jgi:acetoin utilization protein AcuB